MEEAVVEAARGDVRTTRVVALVPVAVQVRSRRGTCCFSRH